MSRAETINNWTQTVALIAAGAWAVFTFYDQQLDLTETKSHYVVPRIDIEPGPDRFAVGGEHVRPLRVKMTLANSSEDVVQVVGAYWELEAGNIRTAPADQPPLASIDDGFSPFQNYLVNRDDDVTVVGRGMTFRDEYLGPGETGVREGASWIPADVFDYVYGGLWVATRRPCSIFDDPCLEVRVEFGADPKTTACTPGWSPCDLVLMRPEGAGDDAWEVVDMGSERTRKLELEVRYRNFKTEAIVPLATPTATAPAATSTPRPPGQGA